MDTAYSVAFSPDNTYLTVGYYSGNRISTYKLSGNTFSILSALYPTPGNIVSSCAYSPDGVYLAAAAYGELLIYKRSGDTFTNLPITKPTGNVLSVAFSGDGLNLMVGCDASPYLAVYSRSGDTFTKITDPSPQPASAARGVAVYPRAFEGVV